MGGVLVGEWAGGARDARFGVAVTAVDGPAALGTQLDRIGAGSWYSYDLAPDAAGWPDGRAVLLRTGRGGPRFPDDRIAAAARARPGSAWLIGNEPNVPGQDELGPEAYAQEFARYRALLKAADPRAVIVAPNIQNVAWSCPSCQGVTAGSAFLDGWRAAHRAVQGGEPSFDAFGLHLYALDWDRLPMTDAGRVRTELEAARAYLDAVPEWRGRPIWVTEVGVVWGYPGFTTVIGADGREVLQPLGRHDELGVARFLEEVVGHMRDPRLGVARWYVFSSSPHREPYASEFAGLALFAGSGGGAPMSAAGRAYAELARTHAR